MNWDKLKKALGVQPKIIEDTVRRYENEQHERAMNAPIKKETLDEELRRKGLI